MGIKTFVKLHRWQFYNFCDRILNDFIKTRFIVKSKAYEVLFGNAHSFKPYKSTGTHLCIINVIKYHLLGRQQLNSLHNKNYV